MVESFPINHEKEASLGLTTLEITQGIVRSNPRLQIVNLRPYYYIPNKPSDNTEHGNPKSRDDFLNIQQQDLDNWADSLGEGFNIALDSRVVLVDGSKGHFVMADLAPEQSEENLDKIKKQFSEVVQPRFGGGYFLATNRSYHYIGEKIVNQEDWYELLGRLLITSIVTKMPDGVPNLHEVIVDYRYIGHSLIRNSTGLRLTTKGKKTVVPTVIDFI